MSKPDLLTLSLTGAASHILVRKPGVGSITIGPPSWSGPQPDLVVGVDDIIDWSVFDPYIVPAGYPWPRYFIYQGNDTGFFNWSTNRPIERFEWSPKSTITIDASKAQIRELVVKLQAPLQIVLPQSGNNHTGVTVMGDPSLLQPTLAKGSDCPSLTFFPETQADGPLGLPQFVSLASATSVAVTTLPLRQAFDCASLLQFPDLQHLKLSGDLTNLETLSQLQQLAGLQLRYCHDLSGLPPLDTWPHLTHLLADNVEEQVGKCLRKQVNSLNRSWEYTFVSRLRKPEWFTTQYSWPFSGWQAKHARTLMRTYRATQTAISAAVAPSEVETAIREFVRASNELPYVDTTQREDIGEAVARLAAHTPFGNMAEPAQAWFDADRDF